MNKIQLLQLYIPHHPLICTTKSLRLNPRAYLLFYKRRGGKLNGKSKNQMLDTWALLYLFFLFLFVPQVNYTHDLHILPSKEITMIETSSW